jgi:hypothetical protein
MTVVHHEIAGISFLVSSDFPIREFSLPRFDPFSVESDSVDCHIHVHKIDLLKGTLPAGEPVRIMSNSVRERLAQCMEKSSDVHVQTNEDSLLCIDFRGRRLDIFFTGDLHPGGGHFRFGAFPYSVFLHEYGSVMLHSSCVDCRGLGLLFLAPDEGGKTTAARLMEGCRVLADDMVLVRRGDDGFRAWGTPWTTFEPSTASSPLSGLFLLEKADRFRLEKLTFREVFSHIWEEHAFIHRVMPPEHRKAFFGLCCDISSSAPAWRLHFPPDHIDTDAVTASLAIS